MNFLGWASFAKSHFGLAQRQLSTHCGRWAHRRARSRLNANQTPALKAPQAAGRASSSKAGMLLKSIIGSTTTIPSIAPMMTSSNHLTRLGSNMLRRPRPIGKSRAKPIASNGRIKSEASAVSGNPMATRVPAATLVHANRSKMQTRLPTAKGPNKRRNNHFMAPRVGQKVHLCNVRFPSIADSGGSAMIHS